MLQTMFEQFISENNITVRYSKTLKDGNFLTVYKSDKIIMSVTHNEIGIQSIKFSKRTSF